MPIRWTMLIGSIVVLVAACGDGAGTEDADSQETAPDTQSSSTSETAGDQPAIGTFPDGPSALQDMYADGFPEPLVDPDEVISGGPPPDGIPPIDAPDFLDVASNLDVLPANEPVVALEINGDARAYPIRAMVWHEIVNDTVGGVPVAVTYCPLCNSAAAYDRRIDGAETTFGTSGRLFASALVMYDRATESLWTHYNGTSVIGLLAGEVLDEYAAPLLAWGDFADAYPTGQVLDWTTTGYGRDYGRNPYTGYDDPDGTPFLFRGALDDRGVALQRVVGIEVGDESIAYTLEAVSAGGGKATAATVGGEELVIFWKPGQASALDDVTISGGMDVGSVGVFRSNADGQNLSFAHNGESYVDVETGSSWTITGEAIAGPLAGVQLERIPHLDTFWFAWSTYQPDTRLVEG